MDPYTRFPDAPLRRTAPVSDAFLERGVRRFIEACRFVHELPYDHNKNRDDFMSLFSESKGTCTTTHAVIALLARELALPVGKTVGIYAMTEDLATGTDEILRRWNIPYLPMTHCFLTGGAVRVDLTEGNTNGKNRSIETFLHAEAVQPDITAKSEYLLFRNVLKNEILPRPEMAEIELKTLLHARSEGLELLKKNMSRQKAHRISGVVFPGSDQPDKGEP